MPEIEGTVTQEQAAPETTPEATPPAEPPVAETTTENPTGAAASTETAPAGMPDTLLDQNNEPEAAAAPEAYAEFEGADGRMYAPEQVSGFVDAAKELGLSQEKAQKLFTAMEPTAREFMQRNLAETSAAWAEQAKADPEFGGDNFEQNAAIIRQAYREFTTPEFREIVKHSGLGNHPEFLRLFYRVGTQMQQDHGVAGSASAPAVKKPRYPKSNMVVDY